MNPDGWRWGAAWLLLLSACSPAGPRGGEQVATSTAALTWAVDSPLLPTDLQPGNEFGHALAARSDLLLVGAPGKLATLQNTALGKVYAFEPQANSWQSAYQLASPTPYTAFGFDLSLDGNRLAVGAPLDGTFNPGGGATYLYELVSGSWVETDKLLPTAPLVEDFFGSSVALDGDLLAVGAPSAKGSDSGGMFVFEPDTGGWQQTYSFEPQKSEVVWYLGWAVALEGNTLAVSAPTLSPGNMEGPAFVWVLRHNGVSWETIDELTNPQQYDYFGTALLLQDGLLLVGAPGGGGVVYGYRESGGNWEQQFTLTGSATSTFSRFGAHLALEGDLLAVAAPGTSSQPGALYLFRMVEPVPVEEAVLALSWDAILAGHGAAIADGSAFAGVTSDDTLGEWAGAVYPIRLKASNGDGCGSADECASGFCVDELCCDRICDDPCEACAAALKLEGDDGVCGVAQSCAENECQSDGHTLLSPTGEQLDCAPYGCTAEGLCRDGCTSTVDCAPANRCNAQGKCVAVAPVTGANGGCTLSRTAGPGAWLLCLLCLPALRWAGCRGKRRRRRHLVRS